MAGFGGYGEKEAAGLSGAKEICMKAQLRHLVAGALYPTKAYSLPAVCEHYGLDPGDSQEAFSSKTRYVMRRLERVTKMTNTTPALMLKAYPDDQHYI
jgi:hypothetical protein